jgi:hypothetical protein
MPITESQRADSLQRALRHLAPATKDLAFAESLALSAQALDLARDVAAERQELQRLQSWIQARRA